MRKVKLRKHFYMLEELLCLYIIHHITYESIMTFSGVSTLGCKTHTFLNPPMHTYVHRNIKRMI